MKVVFCVPAQIRSRKCIDINREDVHLDLQPQLLQDSVWMYIGTIH